MAGFGHGRGAGAGRGRLSQIAFSRSRRGPAAGPRAGPDGNLFRRLCPVRPGNPAGAAPAGRYRLARPRPRCHRTDAGGASGQVFRRRSRPARPRPGLRSDHRPDTWRCRHRPWRGQCRQFRRDALYCGRGSPRRNASDQDPPGNPRGPQAGSFRSRHPAAQGPDHRQPGLALDPVRQRARRLHGDQHDGVRGDPGRAPPCHFRGAFLCRVGPDR